jgi:SAM-dependent methyltransferase
VTTHDRPTPFCAYTAPALWDDPHVSAQMLAAHLDPLSPLASRPHAFVDRSAAWLVPALGLSPGDRLLDLGCGPGLYAERVARRGVRVLGVDVASRSLAHARDVARRDRLPVELRHGSYLDPGTDLGDAHDAAVLVFEDYSVLSPDQRATLLARVHGALRPGGRLLLDVTSAARFATVREGSTTAPGLMGGFWSAEPYDGTHETFTYPGLRLVLDRYTIRTARTSRVFWNWMQCLTPHEVAAELRAAGFAEPDVHGDVAGATYDPGSPTFAVLTRRA